MIPSQIKESNSEWIAANEYAYLCEKDNLLLHPAAFFSLLEISLIIVYKRTKIYPRQNAQRKNLYKKHRDFSE